MNAEDCRADGGGGGWRDRLFKFASCCALGMLAAIEFISSYADGSALSAVVGVWELGLKRRLRDSILEFVGAGGRGYSRRCWRFAPVKVIGEPGRSRFGLGGSEIDAPGCLHVEIPGCGSCDIFCKRDALGLRNELAMLPTKTDMGLRLEEAVDGRRLVIDGSLGSSPKEGPIVLTGLTGRDI